MAISLCTFAGIFSPRWLPQVSGYLGPQWGPFQGINGKSWDTARSEVHSYETLDSLSTPGKLSSDHGHCVSCLQLSRPCSIMFFTQSTDKNSVLFKMFQKAKITHISHTMLEQIYAPLRTHVV